MVAVVKLVYFGYDEVDAFLSKANTLVVTDPGAPTFRFQLAELEPEAIGDIEVIVNGSRNLFRFRCFLAVGVG